MAPLTSEELLALATTDTRETLPQESLVAALTSPPFVPTRSLVNIRDAGAVPGSALPSGLAYRCGALRFAADDPDAMTWLGGSVKKIFDLRKGPERAQAPDPEIPGVESVWFDTVGEYPTPDLAKFAIEDGNPAWAVQLLNVALMYKPTIKAILEHVRDHPKEPFLFHCTAGRDRTGMVGGMLQTLAGTPPDAVELDYLLSRIGTEPARDKLLQFAMMSVGITDPETPGFLNLVSLRAGFWRAFSAALEEKFGGWDGYITEYLGLSKEDLETVKKNLRS